MPPDAKGLDTYDSLNFPGGCLSKVVRGRKQTCRSEDGAKYGVTAQHRELAKWCPLCWGSQPIATASTGAPRTFSRATWAGHFWHISVCAADKPGKPLSVGELAARWRTREGMVRARALPTHPGEGAGWVVPRCPPLPQCGTRRNSTFYRTLGGTFFSTPPLLPSPSPNT